MIFEYNLKLVFNFCEVKILLYGLIFVWKYGRAVLYCNTAIALLNGFDDAHATFTIVSSPSDIKFVRSQIKTRPNFEALSAKVYII